MLPPLSPFHLQQWVDANREPFWARKTIWEDSDFWVFVSRGPNDRKEFHINPNDEIFYQLEGELHLHLVQPDGQPTIAVLRAGEMFLLPAGVPHSPRRGEGSWSYVVERRRGPETTERWRWYCDACNSQLYEVTAPSGSPAFATGSAIADGLAALRADAKLRTCTDCGHTSTF